MFSRGPDPGPFPDHCAHPREAATDYPKDKGSYALFMDGVEPKSCPPHTGLRICFLVPHTKEYTGSHRSPAATGKLSIQHGQANRKGPLRKCLSHRK